MTKVLIAGNWKMNLDYEQVDKLVDDLVEQLSSETLECAQLAVCPSAVYLSRVLERVRGADIALGAQDCSEAREGAYTGQVSAAMLANSGCSYVIVGHSERRQYNGETDAVVLNKAKRAMEQTVTPIICVGETEEQRDNGEALAMVGQQLKGSVPKGKYSAREIVIAYEPVWAIGTGKVASPDDVEAMHAFIYETLAPQFDDAEKLRILYGGSMKPANAATLLAIDHVDGGLIGGASLEAESFLAIASSV